MKITIGCVPELSTYRLTIRYESELSELLHEERLPRTVSRDYESGLESETSPVARCDFEAMYFARGVLAARIRAGVIPAKEPAKPPIIAAQPTKTAAETKEVDFYRFFEDTVAQKKGNNASYTNTIQHIRQHMANLPLNLSAVTREWVEEWVSSLMLTKCRKSPEKLLSRNTVAQYLQRLRIVMEVAHERGLIASNPVQSSELREIRKQYEPPMVEWLEMEELRRLQNAPCINLDIKQAFMFACFTGLRISDLRALRFGDLRGTQLGVRQKKTRQPIYMELSATAQNIIETIRASIESRGEIVVAEMLVFPDLPTNNGSISYALREWSAAAALTKHLHFHLSRHTFAMLAMDTSNGDIYAVSKLLGHTSVLATQRYADVRNSRKTEIIQGLPTLTM